VKPLLTCALLTVSNLSAPWASAQMLEFGGYHPGMSMADFVKRPDDEPGSASSINRTPGYAGPGATQQTELHRKVHNTR
jgi:hypothetical protein